MGEARTARVQTEVAVGLLTEMRTLVQAGWFRDLDELMVSALCRFVESHRGELMERFIREDIEWGLRESGDGARPCPLQLPLVRVNRRLIPGTTATPSTTRKKSSSPNDRNDAGSFPVVDYGLRKFAFDALPSCNPH